MNTKYLIMGSDGLGGWWGMGDTLEDAEKRYRKSGGKKRGVSFRKYSFTSELPFAPPDREATTDEADAWVGRNGSINWIRCERQEI